MKLNLDFTGATLLKEWWQTVKANFEEIQSHSTEAVIDHPDKSVTSEKIADYAVKTMKLANESVSAGKIATDAVRTTHLKDGNVTMAKLHSDVQTQLNNFQEHINNPSQEIADGAVTMDKLNEDVKSEIDKINDTYLITDPIDLESKGLTYDENLGEMYLSTYAPDSNALYIIKDAKGSAMYITDADGVAFKCVTLAGGNPAIETGDTVTIKFIYPDTEGEFGKFFILSRTSSGGSSITVDSELSDTSTNAVQNKVVKAELDKKYEIPNENADYLLKQTGTDESGNALQINTDLLIPYLTAGINGGYVSFGESSNVYFEPNAGFETLANIIDGICDLQDRVSALEG